MEGTSIKFIYATSHPSANNEASSWVGAGGGASQKEIYGIFLLRNLCLSSDKGSSEKASFYICCVSAVSSLE